MSIPLPIFPDSVDKRISEYLRRLAENQNKLESDLRYFINNPLPSSSNSISSIPAPIIPSPSSELANQNLVDQTLSQILGQLPQGQFTYAPVVTTLPMTGDVLSKNGQIIFLESPPNTYTQYTFKALVDPGAWVIVPTLTSPSTLRPSCRVFNSIAQSIPNNVITVLTYNSERYDTDNIHDNAVNPNRLTCQTSGKYIITLNISFATNTVGFRGGYISFNGTVIGGHTTPAIATAGERTLLSVATEYSMAIGDFVDSSAFQNSGGALNVEAQANYSLEFSMALVST